MARASQLNSVGIRRNVIVLGASSSGIAALTRVLADLPRSIPATIAVAVHRLAVPVSLVDVLGRGARVTVLEPSDAAGYQHGRVYVAPPGKQLVLERDQVRLDPIVNGALKATVDPLFISASKAHGPRVVGALVEASSDGTLGLIKIRSVGGIAVMSGTRDTLRRDAADAAVSVDQLATVLDILAQGKAVPAELVR